jgi:hypothetical protein
LKEFDQLFEEHQNLLTQFTQLQKEKAVLEKTVRQLKESHPGAEKTPIIPSDPETKLLTIANLDQLSTHLKALGASFGNAVSELSTQLVAEVSQFAVLCQQVTEETRQLEQLHDLKVTDATLDSLLQEYTEKSQSFMLATQQRNEAFQLTWQEKQQAWQKEAAEHTQTVNERNEATKQAWQRDEIEYKYNLESLRKLDQDSYQQHLKNLQKELQKIEAEPTQIRAEREQALAAREQEYQTLSARVEGFPDELETAVQKAKQEARAIVLRQVKMKKDLRAKVEEGEQRVAQLKIKALEEMLEKQGQQIQNLAAKLEATVKQAQAIAIKAIEGASNVTSYQAVREIALEQAKNIPKS